MTSFQLPVCTTFKPYGSTGKKPVRKFRLTEKIANLSQVLLEENTYLGPEQMPHRFYGYRTSGDCKATICGRKVNFSLSIAPPGKIPVCQTGANTGH